MVKMLGEGKNNNGEVRSSCSLFYPYGDMSALEFHALDIVNFHLETLVIVNKADKGRYFLFKDDGSFLRKVNAMRAMGQERLATNGDLYCSPLAVGSQTVLIITFFPVPKIRTLSAHLLQRGATGAISI